MNAQNRGHLKSLRIGEEGSPQTWDPTEYPVPIEVPEPLPEPAEVPDRVGRAA